jgi:hypothetical protein
LRPYLLYIFTYDFFSKKMGAVTRVYAVALTKRYISTKASEPILDTLEFFPHNYQMPQLSSNDRLLMAAKDMKDAFQHHHPDIPFASVSDDTVQALTDLEAIFKLKLQQAPSPATQASPAKVVPRSSLIPSSTQILNSPMPNRRQTRSQTTIPLCHYLRGWSRLGHYVNHL